MTKQKKEEKKEPKLTGLALLRSPFPINQISKLPKGTKAQNQCKKEDKINCKVCGGWHHSKIIHLDYVGHAALTDRLLDCDINWYWEPMAFNEMGLPSFDNGGGLWIRLFVAGHSRIGYGNAELSQYKEVGSREKEVIGDALRNAAMRFGAALDLWHKGDLHIDDDKTEQQDAPQDTPENKTNPWKGPLEKEILTQSLTDLVSELQKLTAKDTLGFLDGLLSDNKAVLKQAEIDVPRWYAGLLIAKKEAEIRIGSFPGDDDPFGLPPIDEKHRE